MRLNDLSHNDGTEHGRGGKDGDFDPSVLGDIFTVYRRTVDCANNDVDIRCFTAQASVLSKAGGFNFIFLNFNGVYVFVLMIKGLDLVFDGGDGLVDFTLNVFFPLIDRKNILRNITTSLQRNYITPFTIFTYQRINYTLKPWKVSKNL